MDYTVIVNDGEHEETFDTVEDAFGYAIHMIDTRGDDEVEDLWKVEVTIENEGVELKRETVFEESLDD